MIRFFASYRVLILLSVIVTIFTAELIVMGSVVNEVDNATTDLKKRLSKLRISETERLLRDLDKELEKHKLPTFNSAEARNWLLEVLGEFRTLYGAKINKAVTESGSSYLSEISFRYLPDKPDDLLKLLKYMKTSNAPIYNVKSVRFSVDKSERAVEINVELIQPFKGGKYDY